MGRPFHDGRLLPVLGGVVGDDKEGLVCPFPAGLDLPNGGLVDALGMDEDAAAKVGRKLGLKVLDRGEEVHLVVLGREDALKGELVVPIV